MTDAPTTPDPIEIAMEAEASGRAPSGVAVGLLQDQRRLVRWQIAGERAGFALKLLTGAAGLAGGAGVAAPPGGGRPAAGVVSSALSRPPGPPARRGWRWPRCWPPSCGAPATPRAW